MNEAKVGPSFSSKICFFHQALAAAPVYCR